MILIVGNILKDVYLSLDSRTETFETDKNGTKWLDLSFDAKDHHYFCRNSVFNGAAVSLEVFQNFGIEAKINTSDFTLDETMPRTLTSEYRYILTAGDDVSYLVPTTPTNTKFEEPKEAPDYIYIDRSAHLTKQTAQQIALYLLSHPNTKLILYLKDASDPIYTELVDLAQLIFTENSSANLNSDKTIFISENNLNYKNLTEHISTPRIDKLTHLSAHSTSAATIISSFLLGKTVEESLKLARLNVENSSLDSTLSLHELNALR